MLRTCIGMLTLSLFLLPASAQADPLDLLQGKFAFNWFAIKDGDKCIKVTGQLLVDFKSSKYHCDMMPKTNTSTEVPARVCTEVKGKKEYLIFDTQKACNAELETQNSNE